MVTEENLTWAGSHILMPGLMLFMLFIVGDLAYRSKAGRFGTLVLFGALGLGMFGFVIKWILTQYVV